MSASTRLYLLAGVAVVALWVALAVPASRSAVTAFDRAVLRAIANVRSAPLTTTMRAFAVLGASWMFLVVAWGTIAVLVVTRRFQHLFTTFALFLVVASTDSLVAIGLGRMRPTGVTMLGHWEGYAHPSRPVAALGLALVAALYTLAPAGKIRNRVAWAAMAPVAALAVARLYLAVDHPTDVLAALVTGMALPVVVFRLVVPNEVFPVRYGARVRAHLDVSGVRGRAIIGALDRQLGIRVRAVEPFSLAASAGSTPLRCVLDGPDDASVFGKLYARSHLRSDRWYKLARAVRYGRLEDEHPFNTVRRLVEYEDHMLRLVRDAGVPTAEPYGFIEITPEREYMIVTEFLAGAVRISDADVDERVTDNAVSVVRRLWDAGLAHRDIKPGNVLVRDGHVWVVDVAFAEARPTPWRQAVDLANMMLTLALYSTPERVYAGVLRQFSPEDVAEAFAASRSVTIPSQLRALIKADGRDLVEAFRSLAPPRDPVAIQRWTLRRAALTATVVVTAVMCFGLLVANFRLSGLL